MALDAIDVSVGNSLLDPSMGSDFQPDISNGHLSLNMATTRLLIPAPSTCSPSGGTTTHPVACS